jgi:hypothetical protein
VIPDAIGAGDSSKPSDGLHTRFPHYGYKDQVSTALVWTLRHIETLGTRRTTAVGP